MVEKISEMNEETCLKLSKGLLLTERDVELILFITFDLSWLQKKISSSFDYAS